MRAGPGSWCRRKNGTGSTAGGTGGIVPADLDVAIDQFRPDAAEFAIDAGREELSLVCLGMDRGVVVGVVTNPQPRVLARRAVVPVNLQRTTPNTHRIDRCHPAIQSRRTTRRRCAFPWPVGLRERAQSRPARPDAVRIVAGGRGKRQRVGLVTTLGRWRSTGVAGPRAARKRKRRMERVEHDLTDEQWAALTAAWGGCAYCGAADTPLQRDCVLALSRGGRYTLDNIVPACRSCNASKCNDEVTGWLRRKRLDERAFLLRHLEISTTLALQCRAQRARDGGPGPPGSANGT